MDTSTSLGLTLSQYRSSKRGDCQVQGDCLSQGLKYGSATLAVFVREVLPEQQRDEQCADSEDGTVPKL